MQDSPPNTRSLSDILVELSSAIFNAELFFSTVNKDDVTLLLTAFSQLNDRKKLLDKLNTQLSALYQELSYNVIPEVLEAKGIDGIKVAGKNFIPSVRMNASIPADKKEVAHQWLRDNGFGELIQPNINPKTLSSAISNHFEETATLPPEETMTIHQQRYIQIRTV
jgi:hypothetical protein